MTIKLRCKQSPWLLTGPHTAGVPQLLPKIVFQELPKTALSLITDSCGSDKYEVLEWEGHRWYQLHILCLEEMKELHLLTIIFAITTNFYWGLLKPTSHKHFLRIMFSVFLSITRRHQNKIPHCLPQIFFWHIQDGLLGTLKEKQKCFEPYFAEIKY